MKIDLQELRNRSEYINEKKHPTLDLLIWNYNQTCQFEKKWDEYTMMCRGLITDLEGNIIARPFKKFFNWGEDANVMIPTEMPIISEKLDGSLGIQYYYGDKVLIATRGSFESDQAKYATGHMILEKYSKDDFMPGYTYLYEIIYPSNRIVIDYQGREELVLIAIINNETGSELVSLVEQESNHLGFNFARRFEVNDIQKLIKKMDTLSGNEEGYVFHWPTENLRIKLKGKEYVRLHKLLTEFSTISIWENLKEGNNLEELLERVPDEFFDWVKNEKEKLETQFKEIYQIANKGLLDVEKLSSRKKQANKILKK